MNLALLLEMAAEGLGDRVAVGPLQGGMSYRDLLQASRRVADWLSSEQAGHVGLIDVNSEAVPVLVFGAAIAGKPFVPLNYRLAGDQLRAALSRIAGATVVTGPDVAGGPAGGVASVPGVKLVERRQLLDVARGEHRPGPGAEVDPDSVAVLLFTSGTTGEPKAAVLRHRHLASYVISTVEFMCAGEDEATLVSVPPYHVAGMSVILSSVYSGRRIVQLAGFDPEQWVDTARRERVTHAMVVPTMLGRILDVVERDGIEVPSLRHLSYGGGRMPVPVIERALRVFPDVDFVNAYGLTETASTIAVLTPADHRQALHGDEAARRRLASVGRPLPTLEVEIRGPDGAPLAPGTLGEIWVRGEQVSGEYLGRGSPGPDGWFATNDSGLVDEEGYLFVEGRLDDVIVRGAENISPGEVEDVLVSHPAVTEAAVVGLPDEEWGERVVAVVVLGDGASASEEELKDWVRRSLRSSRTPEVVEFRDELPYNETGKLLRRSLRAELMPAATRS